MAGLSIGAITRVKTGNKMMTITPVTFDDSYPTGGEALTKAQLGLTAINTVFAIPASGYTFAYDATNSKLLAYSTAGTEVSNTTDLHTLAATVIAIGV